MSYKIIITTNGSDQKFTEKNKDDVISQLAAVWASSVGVGIQIIFPDNTAITYEELERDRL
tara:strand:+ start:281 stop:463 length:183 start_codon:yes stop_codon:yes gene_type:complete